MTVLILLLSRMHTQPQLSTAPTSAPQQRMPLSFWWRMPCEWLPSTQWETSCYSWARLDQVYHLERVYCLSQHLSLSVSLSPSLHCICLSLSPSLTLTPAFSPSLLLSYSFWHTRGVKKNSWKNKNKRLYAFPMNFLEPFCTCMYMYLLFIF